MKIPFVDLKAQYLSIRDEVDRVIQDVITESAFVGGRHVKAFEDHFGRFLGCRHCIGVGNGTDALFIALRCLGIGHGDEVITAANSFIATAEAITLAGARVVFVDCHEETYNIDVRSLEEKITEKTKAIIPVHLYGQPADMGPIMEITRGHGLLVVEDAAQAHGAKYRGKNVGTFGDCACFSFFPGKNLGAYGDAGAIVTDDDDLARKVRMFANHGRIEKYDHEFEGMNSRLDGLQAAILDVKLKHLDDWTARREEIAAAYCDAFGGIVKVPAVLPYVRHVHHLYVVRVRHRERVMRFLKEQGIATGIHYPIPLPFLAAYAYLHHDPGDFPVAYSLKDEILSLPIHGSMTDEQVEYVISELRRGIAS